MAVEPSGTDAQSEARNGWQARLRRRAPLYGAAAVCALLGLAYFDGGEEPIHPIAQQIALPGDGK